MGNLEEDTVIDRVRFDCKWDGPVGADTHDCRVADIVYYKN